MDFSFLVFSDFKKLLHFLPLKGKHVLVKNATKIVSKVYVHIFSPLFHLLIIFNPYYEYKLFTYFHMVFISYTRVSDSIAIFQSLNAQTLCFALLIADFVQQKSKKFFVGTFLGSIMWIAIFSYLMVWWAHQVSHCRI